MKKNRIDGVKPFNEFFFKSCYYHQLLAGLSCFGIGRDAILFNAFILIIYWIKIICLKKYMKIQI